MKIELEMKINEEEENNDVASQSLMNSIKDKDKHEVLFSPESSQLYSAVRPEANYEYDYEINQIRFGEEKEKEFMYIKTSSKVIGDKYIKIDPENGLLDTLNYPYAGDDKLLGRGPGTKLAKANIFKRLVSKKKRRLQNEYYDLDMAYITERIIGMGFPATGCETFYRNSLVDLKTYLDRYHGEYKIYNLCIEKKRIYPKNLWIDKKVGLFPFNDHAPCPIKLILDFCIDLCIYLTANPRGVAAIHCKAGKGRTGVMIVCYLIFSELCQTTDEALAHYASQRTLNNKGVTIPSQIRYIKYFETYLSANFERPFMRCIPKIIKSELNKGYENMIVNYNTDMSYFTTINGFKLKSCLIGPFTEEMNLQYDFSAITRKKLDFANSKITRKLIDQAYYYEIELNSDDVINYDLKLAINGKNLKFYSWFNLWFNTFEIISKYVLAHNCFEEQNEPKVNKNFNRALSEIEVGEKDMPTGRKRIDSAKFLSSVIQKSINGSIKRKKFSNAFKKVLAKYTQGKRKKSAIKTMKNNKDLNDILEGINAIAKERNVELLDRKNLEFVVERKQLDKLKTKIKDDFKVKYTYELLK